MDLFKILRMVFREWNGRPADPVNVPIATKVEPPVPIEVTLPTSKQIIPVVSAYDLQSLESFFLENETLINRYIVKRVSQAIKHDDDSALLFYIALTGHTASVRREDFEATLNNIIAHFIKVEEYERIAKCKKLLERHSVNEVIRRSQ